MRADPTHLQQLLEWMAERAAQPKLEFPHICPPSQPVDPETAFELGYATAMIAITRKIREIILQQPTNLTH